MTTFRRFRNGKTKQGKQQYIWVCLVHHNEKNLANYHANRTKDESSSTHQTKETA